MVSPAGPCRGPGGVNDKVNHRSAIEHSQEECEAECSALDNCVGFSYCAVCNGGECILHGEGLDGTCSDPSALNEVACEGLGTCEFPDQTTEDTCGTCSESTALSETLCIVVGGTWLKGSWQSASAVWEGPEDPWTGGSHHSTVIKGTTEEANSNYVCLDADLDDHFAHCIGDDASCNFQDVSEENRILENCPSICTYVPAPVAPREKPPHAGDIKLPGWDAAMSGACRGGPDHTDKVNGKYSNTAGADGVLTQSECADECLAEADCLGYAHSTAWCIVYGPNLHETPGDGWTGDNHAEVKITGTKANPSYICVTGPPRNVVDEVNKNDPEDATSSGNHLAHYSPRSYAFFGLVLIWRAMS